MTARTATEVAAAIEAADRIAQGRTTQSRRLIAQAVADTLRWTLGDVAEFNLARTIIEGSTS